MSKSEQRDDWRERLREAVRRSGKKQQVVAWEARIDTCTLSRVLTGKLNNLCAGIRA